MKYKDTGGQKWKSFNNTWVQCEGRIWLSPDSHYSVSLTSMGDNSNHQAQSDLRAKKWEGHKELDLVTAQPSPWETAESQQNTSRRENVLRT